MVHVSASSVIDAPLQAVWPIVRDFDGLPKWLPIVASSTIENGEAPDRVGCVRSLRLVDGSTMREQLVGLSDRDHTVTFSILSSELPFHDYLSTVSLRPVTDGDRTFILWEGRFEVVGDREAEMKTRVERDVYQAGFTALKGFVRERLGRGSTWEGRSTGSNPSDPPFSS